MAVRTYAQLIADIALYLDTNPKITAAEHKQLETNIVDTLFDSGSGSGARPYKVYKALLSQLGGAVPPSVIVLENTLGVTPVWTYSTTGIYIVTATGVFTLGKTFAIPPMDIGGPPGYCNIANKTVNDMELWVIDGFTSLPIDNNLTYAAFEIQVYP